MRCLICNGITEAAPISDGRGICDLCNKMPYETRVKLYQLRRIADALENIERKMKDGSKW